jgi:hypothetical protein
LVLGNDGTLARYVERPFTIYVMISLDNIAGSAR